jgi:uncharacterized protein (TIGR00299 family) protein
MLLGALLDAGADLGRVNSSLSALGATPLRVSVEEVRRHGLRAVKAEIVTPDGPAEVAPAPARSLGAVLETVERADLPEAVRRVAVEAFSILGKAEGRVHGTDAREAHLHEAGALDAIGDVVGSAAALDSLGLLDPAARVVVSAVALGSGSIRSAHGRLPIPGPAALQILADVGAPVLAGPPLEGELCTPTGAALLAAIAGEWSAIPAMRVRAIGIGAGTTDPSTHPNVLRAVLGTQTASAASGDDYLREEMLVLESTVDDLDPRLWPGVLEAMVRAGSADAWLSPVLMRKGRPGHVVTALLAPSALEAVARALFEQTTTLGLRIHGVQRRALARDEVEVRLDGEKVRVKRGYLDGRVVTAQPEFADAETAAAAAGKPVRFVIEQAAAKARSQADGSGPPKARAGARPATRGSGNRPEGGAR